MGKTYEALERAEKEYEGNRLGLLKEPKLESVFVYPPTANHHPAMECYEELKINLLAGHTQGSIKSLLISGTNHGDGSSTIALNFAATLTDCQHKVLLMDANLRTPSLHQKFCLKQECGLTDLLTNGRDPTALIKKVDRRSLSVVTCGLGVTAPVSLFESKIFYEFLKAAREKFDYVILDGPPTPIFTESRVLCSKVDGVILVIAAGRTREHVAKRAKQEIEEAGGKILGLVLNRRKFHIPEWIYRRL